MPTRFVPIDGENEWQDIQAIHAVMAYPEDENLASDRFWAPVWMDRALAMEDEEDTVITKQELVAMLQASSVDRIVADAKKHATSGQISGHILMLCAGMDGGGSSVSIRQAKFLLRDYYLRLRRTHGRVIKHSVRSIDQAWHDFRSVAHLWAAYSAIGMQPAGAFKSITSESLPNFISWSEWFRVKGESLIPPRQKNKAPLLDPDTTWNFPSTMVVPLPDDTRLRLPSWATRVLSGYQRK